MSNSKIDLTDVMSALSMALDLIDPRLTDHHRQVAFLAVRLAEEMGLPLEQRQHLALAAMVHDIGASGTKDAALRLQYAYLDESIREHSEAGYILLAGFPLLAEVAEVVRFHHIPWSRGAGQVHAGRAVPLLAQVLQLADRVQVLINRSRHVLEQVNRIVKCVVIAKDTIFHPDVVDAFLAVAQREAFWLDLASTWRKDSVLEEFRPLPVQGDGDALLDIARFFGRVIDSRSRFTASHSAGVAAVAEAIGQLAGLGEDECSQLRLAGYLHDIGKLSIPNDILEKAGALSSEEFALIRSHTYHTQRVLERIPAFSEIATMASHHHENLNGTGYPFHVSAQNLSPAARIMAVADVFTAVAEDRPYRGAMHQDAVMAVLAHDAAACHLDAQLVGLVTREYQYINIARIDAQSAYCQNGSRRPPPPEHQVTQRPGAYPPPNPALAFTNDVMPDQDVLEMVDEWSLDELIGRAPTASGGDTRA
jgi:HD-GYP domain-containing protein (c-di-GMP phosphodiesterase class II)